MQKRKKIELQLYFLLSPFLQILPVLYLPPSNHKGLLGLICSLYWNCGRELSKPLYCTVQLVISITKKITNIFNLEDFNRLQ